MESDSDDDLLTSDESIESGSITADSGESDQDQIEVIADEIEAIWLPAVAGQDVTTSSGGLFGYTRS